MFKFCLKLPFRLPLPILQGIGACIGWAMYYTNKNIAHRIQENLHFANITTDEKALKNLARQSALETGKGLIESIAIWFSPQTRILKWVKKCQGWEHIDEALAAKKGIIFLTPHLGCYEIAAQYFGAKYPLTALFRPTRQKWLRATMFEGRSKGLITLAETNSKGIRLLMKALKNNESIGILPDQVPALGEGEWAYFFEKPAYTMLLATKIAESSDASIILAFGERLPWGRGYIIHIAPLIKFTETNNLENCSPQAINHGIEKLIKMHPEQYLWSYPRYNPPPSIRKTIT